MKRMQIAVILLVTLALGTFLLTPTTVKAASQNVVTFGMPVYISGSSSSGSYTDTWTSNDIRHASYSSGQVLDFEYEFQFTAAPKASVTQLGWSFEGYCDYATQGIYLYNFATGSWVDTTLDVSTGSESTVGQSSVSTNYMDSTGVMRMRLWGPSGISDYYTYVDYIYWAVTYTEPLAPTLSYPADSAAISKRISAIDFQWQPATSATNYQIQVDDDPAFGSPLIDTTTTQTWYQYTSVSSLVAGTTYYWHVRSQDSNSAWGSYSTSRHIHVYDPLSVPTLSSPSDGYSTKDSGLTLSWNAPSAFGDTISSYDLWTANNPSFTSGLVTYSMTGTSKAVTVASNNWFWKVRALGSMSVYTNWSATRKFVSDSSAPSAPTLNYPSNGSIAYSLRPALEWSTATDGLSDPVTYHVMVSTYKDFGGMVWFNATVSRTWFNATTDLSTSFIFYWKVRAVDTLGNIGSWSGVYQFTVSSEPSTDVTLYLSAYGIDGWGIPFDTARWFVNGTRYTVASMTLNSYLSKHVNLTVTDFFSNTVYAKIYLMNATTAWLDVYLQLVSVTLQSYKMTVCNITYAGQPVKTLKFMDSITTSLKPASYTLQGMANNGSAFQGNPMAFNKAVTIVATSTTVTLVVPPLVISSVSFSASDISFSYAVASSKPSTTWFRIYDNSSLIVPKTYGLSGIWGKSSTYGYHNLTLSVGDNDGYAYNFTNSYFVSARFVTFEFYSTIDGLGLDPSLFQLYVNGSRVWNPGSYETTGRNLFVQVFDYYMNSLYSGVSPYSRVIQIGLGYYEASFFNNGENNIILNVTSNSYALNFQGAGSGDTLIVPWSNSLSFSNQITVSLWIWQNSTANYFNPYVNLWGGTLDQQAFHIAYYNGIGILFYMRDTLNAVHQLQFGSPPFNTWSRYVFTYDGQRQRAYLNGALLAEGGIDVFTINDGAYNLGIGYIPSYSEFNTARIADVVIATRAWSAAEALFDYQNKQVQNLNGIVLRLKTNEGAGTSVYDISGSGNNGAISANTTWHEIVNPPFVPIRSIPIASHSSSTIRMIAKTYTLVGFGVRTDNALVQFTSTTITVPSSNNVYTFHDQQSGPVYITYKNQAGHTLKFDEFNTTIYTPSLGWVKLGTENIVTMLLSESITVTVRGLFGNLISNETYSYPGIRLIIQIPVYSVTVANNDEVHASYVSFYPTWLTGSQNDYPVNDSKWLLKSDKEWSILAGNYTLRVYYPALGPAGTLIFYNLTISTDYGMYVTNNATVDLYTAYGNLGGAITALRIDVQDRFIAIANQYTKAEEKQQILEDLNNAINEKVTPIAQIDTRLWYTLIAMALIVVLTFAGLWVAVRAGGAKTEAERQLNTFVDNTLGKSHLTAATPSSIAYRDRMERLKRQRRG